MSEQVTKETQVDGWISLGFMSPVESGYYKVEDYFGKEGTAFMHSNKSWKLIDGACEKPIRSWKPIR